MPSRVHAGSALEQAQDLGPNRDIQGRYGFVCNNQLRMKDQRAGDADALALAARMVGSCARIAASICGPMRITGSSEVMSS